VSRQAATSIELTLNCDIEYTCTSEGSPEQGPTFACGGQPAEPPEFNIKVLFNGEDITTKLSQSQYDEVLDVVKDDYSENEDQEYDDGGDAE
jgi:hypothetical protein